MPRWLGFSRRRGFREGGLAFAVALTVLFGLTYRDAALTRALETASLDLRFRLRGAGMLSRGGAGEGERGGDDEGELSVHEGLQGC